MSTTMKKILNNILSTTHGNEVHVKMEMPFDWGVTLSGEVDGKDIAVTNEFDFAQYASEYRRNHPTEKINIINFTLSKTGKYVENAVYDEKFQKEQDSL